jgi:thiol-disulfide isomerase/thioredoxin
MGNVLPDNAAFPYTIEFRTDSYDRDGGAQILFWRQPYKETLVRKFLLLFLAVAAVAMPARALDLGDPAPPIAAETWVTGEPADPTKTDDKTIYLVEVWSVTCPPCVMTIPILNDLQKRYADQGFKIVSFTSDEIGDVKTFLEEHPMEYSSFIDDSEQTSTINYMAVDGRNTIPHAFLFDRSGALVWTGNPLDNLEERLKQVIDGTLNVDKAVAVRDARDALQSSFAGQDVEGMLKALKDLETLEPDNGQYYQVHYRILAELGMGDESDVRELFVNWLEGCKDSADALVMLSVLAMDQGPPSYRYPELALEAAKRAYALDSQNKVEVGLNLAETYKNIGRLDLSMKIVEELAKSAPPEQIEILSTVENFYTRLQELGKNPDAAFNP